MLFGSRKGSFTGSLEDRPGLFATADGGILFLDEVGEVPLESQSKLLRVIESGILRPVGDTRERKVAVRVVAATNQDLHARVERGLFRRDLYYRLSVLPLALPALRERVEDIPALCQHFLDRLNRSGTPKRLAPTAMKALLAHAWPGNIRELKNVLERAVLLSTGQDIEAQDLILLSSQSPAPEAGPFKAAKRSNNAAFEKQYLIRILSDHQGNVTKAAFAAGLARRNFQVLLKKHDITPESYRIKKR
jgi:DNA-binding NtrC family response regulator